MTLALAAGCAIAPPETDPGGEIRDALDLGQAVEFRAEGAPVDEPAGERHLSQAAALRRAVETSAALQAALARVRAAQKEAELAGLLPNPILSLIVREPSGSGSTQIEAGLSADLLAILQRPGRATAAGHRLQAESAQALSTALDIVAEVQMQYAECQVLEELMPVLEQRLEGFDRLVEVTRARLELGAASRHELVAIETQRTELSVEVAQRRLDLRLARLALARSIGEPSGAADWTLDRWTAPAPAPTAEEDWVRGALSARPEIAALEWEIRAREQEAALASGLAWQGAEAGVDYQDEDVSAIGPSVAAPLPLFDTGSTRRERAEALGAEVRHQLTETERAVVEEVRSALTVLQAAQENLDRIASELIPSQERRRAEIEEAFRAGQADITALLVAEEALKRAEMMRLDLERQVSTALVRLQRAVGGPARFHTLAGAGDDARLHKDTLP